MIGMAASAVLLLLFNVQWAGLLMLSGMVVGLVAWMWAYVLTLMDPDWPLTIAGWGRLGKDRFFEDEIWYRG